MSAFLKLDIFRKLPKDLTEPTFCGGVVSAICAILLVILTFTEVKSYISPSVASQISMSSSHASDKFHINIDIEMPFMPCDIIGLDLEDSMGNHVQDYYGELHKNRLSADGEILSTETYEEKQSGGKETLERVQKELEEGQGCQIHGYIEALRVPGNFHIGHHAFQNIKMHLNMQGIKLNNSFKINHLSFGELADFNSIARHFPEAGVMHPLDGFERVKPDDQPAMRVGFYIKAVPSIFLGEFATWILKIFNSNRLMHFWEVFQLTATSETEFQSFESLIIFNYEVSPFAVQYTNARENIVQFLISMCGIIGGVFTMAGIVDSIIHKGSKIVFKDRINKLQ